MKYENIKRVSDVIVSLIALVLLAPLFLVVIALIKLDSQGPVLFLQQRYGKNKKPFTVYKFRSMSVSAPRDTPTNDLRDAQTYITNVGRVMRKLSIDELPQLVNIVQGHMSIVGPRPVVLTEISLITERDKHNANSVKPGISGWAQVNGRDELDDIVKARMDGYYVKNYGLAIDLKCILKTFTVILSAAGHREGHEQNRDERVLAVDEL